MATYENTNTIGIDTGELNQEIREENQASAGASSASAGRFAASLDSLAPKTQDRYELIRSIGFGGMKCVLLVHDRDTGREIAMALMPDYKERPREVHEQFIREARITAFLEHPNIVAVHDIGLDRNGAPFYTMSYLRGLPLTTVLKRIRENRPFESRYYTLDRRLRIFQRVCNAVDMPIHAISAIWISNLTTSISVSSAKCVSLTGGSPAKPIITGMPFPLTRANCGAVPDIWRLSRSQ